MSDQQYLTAEGAERMRAELKQLKGPAREEAPALGHPDGRPF
jgi:hypothetical protein